MSTIPEFRESMQAIGELAPIEVPTVCETLFAVAGASAIRGALGTVYFSFTAWEEAPLVVIDWDVKPIETTLPIYLPDVFARLAALRAACKVVVYPEDIALYAEPTGLGKVVLLEAAKSEHQVMEVPERLSELKLDDRASPALVYVHAAQVKFARPAFETFAAPRVITCEHRSPSTRSINGQTPLNY
jgi:hypothetical protein